MKSANEMIAELAQVLKTTVNGRYALAVAGSHAKGMSDAASDIDFFLYLEDPKPVEERRAIIEAIADPGEGMWITPDFHDGAWGGSMDFRYHGTPIECTAKLLPEFDALVKRTMEGEFEIIPADWTSNGYFTYICLPELDFIRPVDDPYGIIAGYQAMLEKYPPKLRRSIVERFLGRSSPWLDSFHYTSAIGRADILFTGPIVQHLVLDAIQVIFALNEVYFTGDKKLARQLAGLPYCPEGLLQELQFLLSAPAESGALERQRQLLRGIYTELRAKADEMEKGLSD